MGLVQQPPSWERARPRLLTVHGRPFLPPLGPFSPPCRTPPAADSKDQFSLLLPLKMRVTCPTAFLVPSARAALTKVVWPWERVGQHHRSGLESWHLALPPTSCEV